MNIFGRLNWYFLLSLAIILPGMISMAVFGFRLGIDFAGGDQYNLAFTKPVQATAVQKEMDTFNVEAPVQQAARYGSALWAGTSSAGSGVGREAGPIGRLRDRRADARFGRTPTQPVGLRP